MRISFFSIPFASRNPPPANGLLRCVSEEEVGGEEEEWEEDDGMVECKGWDLCSLRGCTGEEDVVV